MDCSINSICDGAGVQVVARVPSAGPVPPPTKVVIPTQTEIWLKISFTSYSKENVYQA